MLWYAEFFLHIAFFNTFAFLFIFELWQDKRKYSYKILRLLQE